MRRLLGRGQRPPATAMLYPDSLPRGTFVHVPVATSPLGPRSVLMQPSDSSALDADSAIREHLSGALAGRYRVERVLGRGGMAHVFLAHDLRHDRPVAIKVLRPELTAALGPERFLREIAITTRLSHPRIVAIYDSGNTDPYSWYVMPYIAGESLRDRLRREGQLSVEDAVSVTTAVAAALSYAHQHGVIHRDIKPENVLFAGGEPIVTDFGIGRSIDASAADRLTDTGLAVGTAEYMSPEQAAADPRLDGRSDEFALGCLAYEMLVGEPPFRGPTMQAVAARRALEPMPSICAVRRGVPPAVERVIRKSLEKAPADRYPTTDAFARALAAAVTGGDTAELRAGTPRRPRWLVRAAAAAGLIALAVAAFAAWQVSHRPRAIPDALAGHVAVLPFRNLTGAAADSALASGLASELTATLKRVPGLWVAAPASAASYARSTPSLDSIGRALHVGAIVTGTLERSAAGDSLRLQVSLMNAAGGAPIWTGSFDQARTVPFAVQDSIAVAVAHRLQPELGAAASASLSNHGTSNLDAQEAYFRGRLILGSRQSLKAALAAFDEAIALDPAYAKAWAGRADAYIFSSLFCCMAPYDGLPLAKRDVLRALELDPTSAEAHTSLGTILLVGEKNDSAARPELLRAIALDSTYAEAHLFLAWSHAARREFPASIAEARTALALSPRSGILSARLGTMYYMAGQYDSAVAQMRRTLELDPGSTAARGGLADIYYKQGRCRDALAQWALLDPAVRYTQSAGSAAFIHARCGSREEGERDLQDLLAQSRLRYIPAVLIAKAHLGLGRKAEFFTWLQKAIDEHGSVTVFDPFYDEVRDDPRFIRIVAPLLPPRSS